MSVQTTPPRLLMPLVAVLAAALAVLVPALAAGTTAAARKTAVTTSPKASELVDVNHATLDELKTLPGIEDAYAAKIVKNRPYANKTQLSSKGVIPAATYKKIRTLIIAKQ